MKKVKSVAFNTSDPYEKQLYQHVNKQRYFSTYIKRLIQRDMEQAKKLILFLFCVAALSGCQATIGETVEKKDSAITVKAAPPNPSELSITKEYGLYLANQHQSPRIKMNGWGAFLPDIKSYNLVFEYDLSGNLQSDKQKMIAYTEKLAKQIFEQRDEMFTVHVYWTGTVDGKRFNVLEMKITRSDYNDVNWESNWTDDVHYFWSGKQNWQDAYHVDNVTKSSMPIQGPSIDGATDCDIYYCKSESL